MSQTVITHVPIPHVVKGDTIKGGAVEFAAVEGETFATPSLDLDALIWPRTEPLPAATVPVAEIVDVLVATGEHLRDDPDGLVAEALAALVRTSPYEPRIVEHAYEDLWRTFDGDRLRLQVGSELGGADVLDGWRPIAGTKGALHACGTRMIHVLAGNAPGVAAMTVARGALTKGVHLLKLPSNDLLSATAVLRALSAVAPGHPVARSFSAVYWRGGDAAVEGTLFRPQFFDKLVAWGGDAAIRNAAGYLGPGFELVAFDPKSSISMIGRESLTADESIAEVAALAAADSVPYNQEACTSSRFHFVEGSQAEVDRYCEALVSELAKERRSTSARVAPLSADIRAEIRALRGLDPFFRVFGADDGSGLVIRSDEPVSFFPSNKTVNVVHVDSLEDAIRHINVATQTVSVHPRARKAALRDVLAQAVSSASSRSAEARRCLPVSLTTASFHSSGSCAGSTTRGDDRALRRG